MPLITYEGRGYPMEGDETLLDCLLRHDVSVPYGCRAGVCQSCLMQAIDGAPPSDAQKGLKDTQKFDKQFLACLCRPMADLDVILPGKASKTYSIQVISVDRLSSEIVRVRLGLPKGFAYRAGQFINITSPDNALRSYSLASVPEIDDFLELHVRRIPSGMVSNWIYSELKTNTELTISEAMGQCFYTPSPSHQPLLLIGTGTGLAPLYGIVRDALHQGHSGPIHLYHGSSHRDGIYYLDEMRGLVDKHPHLNYTPALSRPHELACVASGRAQDLALSAQSELSGWRLYLCGHPEMVNTTKKQAFLAGVNMQDIHADPFTFAPH